MSTTKTHEQHQSSIFIDSNQLEIFEVVLNEIREPGSESHSIEAQSQTHSTSLPSQKLTLQIPTPSIPNRANSNSTYNCNEASEFRQRSVSLSHERGRNTSILKDTHTFGTEIKQKIIIVLLSVTSLIILGFILKDFHSPQYKLFSSACGVVFISFYGNWIYLLLRTKNLHRIKTKTKKILDYGNIIFATEIKEYINYPVKSMSELFALRGSSVQPLFLAMCCFISALVSASVALHWIDTYQNATWVTSYKDKEYVEIYFAICSSVATGLIGYFDLNLDDKISVIMHYVGVIFMIASVFPYCIITNWSLSSMIIAGLAVVSWILWTFFSECVYPDKYEMNDDEQVDKLKRKVHIASLVCVLSETIGCIFASLCNVMYIWSMQDMTTLTKQH
eukprot:208596_1